MSERGRSGWLPWRGPNPVLWTMALALVACAVGALVAASTRGWATVSGRPTPWWDAPAPTLATAAALVAFALALLSTVGGKPDGFRFSRAAPARDKVAVVLLALAAAVVAADVVALFAAPGATFRVRPFAQPVVATLVLASAVASTRRRWVWLWFTSAVVSWGLVLL